MQESGVLGASPEGLVGGDAVLESGVLGASPEGLVSGDAVLECKR